MRPGRFFVAAVLVAVAVPLGSPAIAATDPCPKGYLCLYRHADFRGGPVKMKRSVYSEKVYYAMNDEASSVKNKSGRDVILYADFESGDEICLQPGEKIADLSATTPDMNDTISSTTILPPGDDCT
jgi:hypothetical protein